MIAIWATRGRSWGFRFVLDGGLPDPLPEYENAFEGTEGEGTVYRRLGSKVALRFPDPLGRCDDAGRTIPHDLVVPPPLADEIHSSDDGQQVVWPFLSTAFARLWALPEPPTPTDVDEVMGTNAFPGA